MQNQQNGFLVIDVNSLTSIFILTKKWNMLKVCLHSTCPNFLFNLQPLYYMKRMKIFDVFKPVNRMKHFVDSLRNLTEDR